MPIYNADARLAAPAPRHTLTKSAGKARAAVTAYARRKKDGELVTKHPKRHSGIVPAAAERFVQLAMVAGWRVKVVEGFATMNAGKANEHRVEAIQVAGIDQAKRRGFRATWVAGKAGMGIWYEAGITPKTGQPVGVAGVVLRVNGGTRT